MTYKTIGEQLIRFADKVDVGKYQEAVTDLETLECIKKISMNEIDAAAVVTFVDEI